MSIWSKFFDNSHSAFRIIPNPDDYEGEKIFNYPFVKNKKGHYILDSKYERIAFKRFNEEKAYDFLHEQRVEFAKNRQIFKNIHDGIDRWIEESKRRNQFYNEDHDGTGFDFDDDDIENVDNVSLKTVNMDIEIGSVETKINFKKLPPFSLN